MKKRMFVVTALVGIVATALTVAAVNGAVGRKALTPLPSSSCSPIQGPKDADFLIASDLPLQGAGRTQTVEMTKAIAFVLKNHGNKAGKYTVAYQSCDDSTAQAGKWDSGKCSANANAYAGNDAVIGVIGTFNSGCAAIEIRMNNSSGIYQVDGLLKAKLRGSGLEPYVEVIAHLDTEEEKRLVPVFRLGDLG